MKVRFVIYASLFLLELIAIPWVREPVPSWAMAWTATVTTLFLGIIALFQERFWNWLKKPELVIGFWLKPPDCHRTWFGGEIGTYYFRLRIINNGKSLAKDVEVIVEELYKNVAGSTYKQDAEFLPLNLVWSHFRGIKQNIQPFGIYKFCDLGFILEPNAQQMNINTGTVFPKKDGKLLFWFDFAIQPFAKPNHLLPGRYRFKITATASNAAPAKADFELYWSGNWKDTDSDMMDKEIVIKKL